MISHVCQADALSEAKKIRFTTESCFEDALEQALPSSYEHINKEELIYVIISQDSNHCFPILAHSSSSTSLQDFFFWESICYAVDGLLFGFFFKFYISSVKNVLFASLSI